MKTSRKSRIPSKKALSRCSYPSWSFEQKELVEFSEIMTRKLLDFLFTLRIRSILSKRSISEQSTSAIANYALHTFIGMKWKFFKVEAPGTFVNPSGSGKKKQSHELLQGCLLFKSCYPLLTSLGDSKTASRIQMMNSPWRSLSPSTDKPVRSALIFNHVLFWLTLISIFYHVQS